MKNHMQPDVWLYRIVVAVLALTVVGSVAGTIVLVMARQSTSDIILALGYAAFGGLTGFFVLTCLLR